MAAADWAPGGKGANFLGRHLMIQRNGALGGLVNLVVGDAQISQARQSGDLKLFAIL